MLFRVERQINNKSVRSLRNEEMVSQMVTVLVTGTGFFGLDLTVFTLFSAVRDFVDSFLAVKM